jgi:hypothetical protein
MTINRDTEQTADQAHRQASPAATYLQAQDSYRDTIDARRRFEELTGRDLSARAYAKLQACGTYDPQRHGDASKCQPLTITEHLEILAAGEMLARYYRHPAQVHQAVLAGATSPQVAAANGADEAHVRQAYRDWADAQHRLHTDYEGKFGLNAADHAAAIRRAAEPPARLAIEPEAGR